MNPDIAIAGQNTQFSKDNQPENAGRKKNRFKQIQSDFELSIEDMRQVIQDILSMSDVERNAIIDSDIEPGYRKAIAAAVKGCIKQGNWTQINYMFDRLFGKATESIRTVDSEGNDIPINIIINGIKS